MIEDFLLFPNPKVVSGTETHEDKNAEIATAVIGTPGTTGYNPVSTEGQTGPTGLHLTVRRKKKDEHDDVASLLLEDPVEKSEFKIRQEAKPTQENIAATLKTPFSKPDMDKMKFKSTHSHQSYPQVPFGNEIQVRDDFLTTSAPTIFNPIHETSTVEFSKCTAPDGFEHQCALNKDVYMHYHHKRQEQIERKRQLDSRIKEIKKLLLPPPSSPSSLPSKSNLIVKTVSSVAAKAVDAVSQVKMMFPKSAINPTEIISKLHDNLCTDLEINERELNSNEPQSCHAIFRTYEYLIGKFPDTSPVQQEYAFLKTLKKFTVYEDAERFKKCRQVYIQERMTREKANVPIIHHDKDKDKNTSAVFNFDSNSNSTDSNSASLNRSASASANPSYSQQETNELKQTPEINAVPVVITSDDEFLENMTQSYLQGVTSTETVILQEEHPSNETPRSPSLPSQQYHTFPRSSPLSPLTDTTPSAPVDELSNPPVSASASHANSFQGPMVDIWDDPLLFALGSTNELQERDVPSL